MIEKENGPESGEWIIKIQTRQQKTDGRMDEDGRIKAKEGMKENKKARGKEEKGMHHPDQESSSKNNTEATVLETMDDLFIYPPQVLTI